MQTRAQSKKLSEGGQAPSTSTQRDLPVASATPAGSNSFQPSTLESITHNTFPLFLRLPREVQDIIWNFSIVPRIVVFQPWLIESHIVQHHAKDAMGCPRAPGLLHVSQGARIVGLRRYELVPRMVDESSEKRTSTAFIYVCWDTDIIFTRMLGVYQSGQLQDWDLGSNVHQHPSDIKHKVQHVAITLDRLEGLDRRVRKYAVKTPEAIKQLYPKELTDLQSVHILDLNNVWQRCVGARLPFSFTWQVIPGGNARECSSSERNYISSLETILKEAGPVPRIEIYNVELKI